MANLTLTWILVGVVIFVGITMLIYNPSWGVYNGIVENNGGSIDGIYSAAYANLSTDMGSLTNLSNNLLEPTNLWSVFTNAGAGLINTLALGLSSIGLLIAIPTYISHINAILESVSFIPSPFWWILETCIIIIVAGLIIRGLRGTILEP